MKILVNDFSSEQETYKNIFRNYGYEENELIFCDSLNKTKTFIAEHLEKKNLHIDAIITNDSSKKMVDNLQASKLAIFKSELNTSYSKSNFRISSIPLILYSQNETRENIDINEFETIIKKNTVGQHDYFISKFEESIKNWRRKLIVDLENLEILNKNTLNFYESSFYKTYYKNVISNNSEAYFLQKTSIVSQEFIKPVCVKKDAPQFDLFFYLKKLFQSYPNF